jgi:beta-phosphoglucomutase-like phosphatase (HAD superfamily)
VYFTLRYNIPIALACALPEARVKEDLKRYNLSQFFDAVVTAEDSGAPEVEFSYSYAAQSISRPAIRCIVVGNSNNSVEAAHELGMKSVIVTGVRPSYDFLGADLVVRNLSQITLFNMKRLFATEEPVAPRSLEELEADPEDEVDDPELDDFDAGGAPPFGFYRR